MPDALVRHFMTTQVHTVQPHAPLTDVASRMSEARVSCVVVCCEQGTPLGVVTERDLTRAYSRDAGRNEAMPARSAMSEGVLSLTSDARCAEAMTIMRDHAVRRLVIVDSNNVLTGIITQTDLLRAHAEEIEFQKELLEQRVAERTRELQELNAKLANLSRIDPLLNIGNRRAMDDELDRLENRARRYQRPYAVALLDVDHFKKFNDYYGHRAGDEALVRVARGISRDIRAADAVFRYGGEEFLVALPEVGEDGAAIAAEHVRVAVESLAIPHEHSPFGRVTVSIGVAGSRADDPSWARLSARADEALYEAKRRGRNRVERLGAKRDAA